MQKVFSAVVGLLIAVAFVVADPYSGTCDIYEYGDATKTSSKSCSSCQWQCLTDLVCDGIVFDGDDFTSKKELAYLADCGDGYWLYNSTGLCVLVDDDGLFFDTQEQDCDDCTWQCDTDSRCESVIFNGIAVANDELATYCPRNETNCTATVYNLLAGIPTASLAANFAKIGALPGANDKDWVGTVFVPTDEAFKKAGINTYYSQATDLPPQLLYADLPNHVVSNVVYEYSQLTANLILQPDFPKDQLQISQLDGGAKTVKTINPTTAAAPAGFVITNLYTCNAVVHLVDAVIPAGRSY